MASTASDYKRARASFGTASDYKSGGPGYFGRERRWGGVQGGMSCKTAASGEVFLSIPARHVGSAALAQEKAKRTRRIRMIRL